MQESLLYRTDAIVICAVLASVMIMAATAGRLLGRRRARLRPAGAKGLGAIEAGMFGLLGLLLAFTFAASASRAESRGALVVDLANAIRTVELRTDLYPQQERQAIRQNLGKYLDALIEVYRVGRDPQALKQALQRTASFQEQLWSHAVRLAADPQLGFASGQMIPALNQVFALAASREVSMELRVPDTIVSVLLLLAVATAFTSGYASGLSGAFSWTGHIGFTVLAAAVIYVTLDLDRPRRGLMRLDAQTHLLTALRDELK